MATIDLDADVLHRAEATLPPDDRFIAAARWLHGDLAVRLAAAGDRPLPREVRAALDAATRVARSRG